MDHVIPNSSWLSVLTSGPFFRHRYRYHTLPNPSCIRIIKLEPLRLEQLDAPLQCSLFNADLGRLGIYLAFSYTWGPSEPAKQLYIDEYFLPITPNLHAALPQLRSFWNGPCYFWVDAICINQEDLEKRSQHVQYMKKIYRSAKTVFSWVGEEAETKKLLSLIGLIHEKICPTSSCRKGEPLPPSHITFEDVEAMSRLGLPPPGDPSWRTLRTLGPTVYFSRI